MCAASVTLRRSRQNRCTKPLFSPCAASIRTWIERMGPATMLAVEVPEPGKKHSVSLQQVECWLEGATTNPSQASKNANLNMMLVHRLEEPSRSQEGGQVEAKPPTNPGRAPLILP